MRAFIAIPVSESVRSAVAKVSKALSKTGIKPVSAENMHLTLFFLGEIDEKKTATAIAILESLHEKIFEMKFSGVGAFPNENFIRVLWAGCESKQLISLYDSLSPRIQGMGYAKEEFRPHLTLARVDAEAKEDAKAFAKKFKENEFGSCIAERIVLFKSTLTPNGPIYEEVYSKQFE